MKLRRMSIIEEGDDPHIRMAYLGIVGSFSVNGVAQLAYTELLKTRTISELSSVLWPKKSSTTRQTA